jgi:hypothetical protein
MTEQTDGERRKKGRSPSYPAIDLKAAIDRARQLWEREHQYPTAIPMIYKHWGYKPGAGWGNLVIAALRKFGLLDYEGSGDDRRGQITDLAVEILDHPDESVKRRAIQKAALMPSIHQELWAEYRAKLPSDESIRWKLLRERNFTPSGADDFIPQYRATLAFAGLTGADTTDQPESDATAIDVDEAESSSDVSPLPEVGIGRTKPRIKSYVVPLADGLDIIVEGPFPVAEDDWNHFLAYLDLMKRGLVRAPVAEPGNIDS